MLIFCLIVWITPVRYMRVKIQEGVVKNLFKMLIKKRIVNTGLS